VKSFIGSLGVCGLLLGACSLGTSDESVGRTAQEIVRGKPEKKRPEVVAVHVQGFGGRTLCTGTYIAPRVVLTAAHCRRFDAIPGQIFVYHGTDYLTDVATLPVIPAPGESSVWARGETSTAHPAYDPSVNYPDLLVVYLDRELPFAPLPLYRSQLPDRVKKGEIVGWGGSRALTADISQVEGSGIKRSAKVEISGSPTEADFHADDPNPGILVPEIRADLLKTNGQEPRANPCAGDSGGPLLIRERGRDFVASVGFWTGPFCEDYSIFTRVDPFLDFIDASLERAGGLPVVPRLECVEELDAGALRAHFGYANDNGLTVSVAYGPQNAFPEDVKGSRPSAFGPSDHAFEFNVDFAPEESLTWTLSPPSGPTTVVQVDVDSPRCEPDNQVLICANQCTASLAAECSDGLASRGQCVNDCVLNASFFADLGCGMSWKAYLRCVAAVPPAAANWDCSFPGFPPFPASPNCDAELFEAFACAGF
jgi:hypothetical protein